MKGIRDKGYIIVKPYPLTMLSAELREAVWLCYFEERSVAEISQFAHCPENTVKTRPFHTRKILRGSEMLRADVNV